MKTNQIMIRETGFTQRTKDGYFNANELLALHNSKSKEKKLLQNYRSQKSSKDFEDYLIKEGIDTPVITSRGAASGTWMHPKVFIDFAMWVSLEFRSKVIDMVIDGLILSRHNAGDYYNQMCASIMDSHINLYGNKPPAMLYINEANMLRELCKINKDRNNLSEQELNKLTVLQKVNSTLIKKGVGVQSRRNQLSVISESL